MSHHESIQYWKDYLKSKIRKKISSVSVMDQVFWAIHAYGYTFDQIDALEVFGMHGLWVTNNYIHRCRTVDLWEINPVYADYAKKLGSKVNVIADDSIKALSLDDERLKTYDFIMIDNPYGGFFGKDYCEHFDEFPHIFKYLKNGKDVKVIAMNFMPDVSFGHSLPDYEQWLQRRNLFYGSTKTKVTPDVAVSAYDRCAKLYGLRIAHFAVIPRNQTLCLLVLIIEPDL